MQDDITSKTSNKKNNRRNPGKTNFLFLVLLKQQKNYMIGMDRYHQNKTSQCFICLKFSSKQHTRVSKSMPIPTES